MGPDAERVRKEEQKKIDESDELTEEELAEKTELLKQVKMHASYIISLRVKHCKESGSGFSAYKYFNIRLCSLAW